MTDEDKIQAVTTKLLGYEVGQVVDMEGQDGNRYKVQIMTLPDDLIGLNPLHDRFTVRVVVGERTGRLLFPAISQLR